MKKFLSSVMFIVLILNLFLAIPRVAYADASERFQDGWLYYRNGGCIYIPNGFSMESRTGDDLTTEGFSYDFYDSIREMHFSTTEQQYPSDADFSTILSIDYYNLTETLPNIVYNYQNDNGFALSGYLENNIYYIQYTLAHSTIFTISFQYPTINRSECDLVVESVCNSFSAVGTCNVVCSTGRPSPADLDAIQADIKYPNYEWMYLNEYINAVVTPRAVYCFRDPDTDIWRKGNVYTVYGGAKVTILAKSEGYACVILNGTNNAGWINEEYLAENYDYAIISNPQQRTLSGHPSENDLHGCNEWVQYPKAGNWLQNYETKYLKTKYGKCAYLRYSPTSDSDYYDYVYEKARVIVLARENGFSLVKVNDGMAGWVTSSLLYDYYPG